MCIASVTVVQNQFFVNLYLSCVIDLCYQEHVAQNACLTSCRHIAQILMDLLLNEDVKQISMGALQQVNLDVIQCERKYRLSQLFYQLILSFHFEY